MLFFSWYHGWERYRRTKEKTPCWASRFALRRLGATATLSLWWVARFYFWQNSFFHFMNFNYVRSLFRWLAGCPFHCHRRSAAWRFRAVRSPTLRCRRASSIWSSRGRLATHSSGTSWATESSEPSKVTWLEEEMAASTSQITNNCFKLNWVVHGKDLHRWNAHRNKSWGEASFWIIYEQKRKASLYPHLLTIRFR